MDGGAGRGSETRERDEGTGRSGCHMSNCNHFTIISYGCSVDQICLTVKRHMMLI